MKLLLTITSILAVQLVSAASPTPFTREPFSDVATSHRNYDAIEYLRQNNVIRGYPDGTFKADSLMNRAEFVHLITNPFLLNTVRVQECVRENIRGKDIDYIFFTDVLVDDWYAPAVCFVKERGIVDGYPNGTFGPGKNISFVEMAKIMSNTLGLNIEEENTELWFEPYVQYLSKNNAIPNTVDRFGESVTRGEMAEILYRLKADVMNKQSRTFEALRF